LIGVDHYNVYVNNTLWNQTNATSFAYVNLSNGLYNLNVTAVDAAGNEGSGLLGSTTVDRGCSVDGTCTPPVITVSGGGPGTAGGGIGGGVLATTTTTKPPVTTTTLPPTGVTTTTLPTTTTTTTLPTAPLTITGLIALVAGNTAYQALIALAVIAVLLTIFRYKWLPKARKGLALLWISSKKAKPRKK